ncbi:twin transmembrane helix small protein [Pelagibacteraceae bacterium]|nr:twin transmembrane helix small protein [Pelagibacteraceae bacterium]
MPNVFYYLLIPITIAAVTLVLFTGIYGMLKGGKFNRQYSNKLMRLRILLQFLAITIIMIALYIAAD